ncbi:MAG: DUF3995 domain-containing protein [Caldimonas sp.]
MNTAVAVTVSLAFFVLALWHFRMALTSGEGMSIAVPSESGKPLFVPSVRATLAVGLILLVFACLVAATAGLVKVGLSESVLSWLCYALALGLLARAVGEFKYVGFFKRERGSKFARLDTLLYSPMCVLLAVGVAFIAGRHGI